MLFSITTSTIGIINVSFFSGYIVILSWIVSGILFASSKANVIISDIEEEIKLLAIG